MYVYEKRLQYPVNIKIKNPKIAQVVISQYGGPYCFNVLLPHFAWGSFLDFIFFFVQN